jgi:hypothetical protein
MLRLIDLPTEPHHIDIFSKLKWLVQPLTTIEYNTAQQQSQSTVRKLVEEHGEIAEMGGRIEGLPDLTDPDAKVGYAQFLFAVGLADAGIISYEGTVGDEDGNAIEPSHEANVKLMKIPQVADGFLKNYTAQIDALFAEGEGSPSAPVGTIAGGQTIAKGAEETTPNAQEGGSASTGKGARTKATSQKPAKGKNSGSSPKSVAAS